MASTSWHKEIKTWKNINQFLFKNKAMSDCSFLVKVGSTSTKVPAHKYILGGYSPEFYNLFYLMKASSDEIPIDDISVESLSSFLEFLYKETTELNMENIRDLFKLADRYSVESFKDLCSDFLLQNITVDNVLTVMDEFSRYKFPSFDTECIKIISRKRLCFEDPSFCEISNLTLTTILKSEELKGFAEIEIFEATNKWAERYCAKEGQPVNSENKRFALGSALQYIRFGAMTNTEFSSCNFFENSVLTPKEIIEIFQFIGTEGNTACQYSGVKRAGLNRKMLFHKSPKNVISRTLSWPLDYYRILKFSVNKPILFYGLEIYGRNISISDTWNIRLSTIEGVTLMENTVKVHFDGSTRTYEILFKDKLLINANEEYLVDMKPLIPGDYQHHQVDNPVDLQPGDLKFCITYRHITCASILFQITD